MKALGPSLPLQRDDKFGAFALITSYKEEIAQNFKNLIMTSPGERMMNPDFGVGMRSFLFEPMDHAVPKIRQRLKMQVDRYMPFIQINKLLFNHGLDRDLASDTNLLTILIEYEVPSINLSTSITIQSEDIL